MFKRWFLLGLILSAGITIGWFSRYFYVHNIRVRPPGQTANAMVRQKTDYAFISPLLACGFSENKPSRAYKVLETAIEGVLDTKKSADNASDASVYFRDLTTGNWTGINENIQYTPASLLKIPVMIAYFKAAETNANLLPHQIEYRGDFNENGQQIIKPSEVLVIGKLYTVEELIKRMIVDSDNNAEDLLLNYIDQDYLVEVFSDLSLNPHVFSENTNGQVVSAKSFSFVFRILYNATYLDKDMSEKALGLLTQASFDKGITAGVPSDIKVAHKFGERTYASQVGTLISRELHECGIVYAPSKPYLLCVMTKGSDFTKSEDLIASISNIVYNTVTH